LFYAASYPRTQRSIPFMTQFKLISAMQTAPTAKVRASCMAVLAEEGDEAAIAPLLAGIDTRPLLHTGNARNDGNLQTEAALKLCNRHKEAAKSYLLDVLNEPAPTTKMFLGIIRDQKYIAAIARKEVAAHILGILYGGKDESLADNLFANVKKGK
jgi:hypothetical protein